MISRGPVLLFLFGLLVLSLPVLLPAHLLTQDGAAHYNTAMALAGLQSQAKPFFERYFMARHNPPENQLASLVMMELARLGQGRQAERIAWGLIFAAYAAVVVANLALLQRRNLAIALLLFPLLAGELVNLGFMNFLIGVVVFLQGCFVLQVGLRRPSGRWLLGLLLVTLLAYAAHPFAAFALAAAAGPLGCAELVRRQLSPQPRSSLLFPAGCALVCVLSALLVAQDAWPQLLRLISPSASSALHAAVSGEVRSDTLGERLGFLLGLSFLSYSPLDLLFSAAFGLMVLWLAAQRLPALRGAPLWRPEEGWLASAACLLTLAVIAPRSFEFFFPERMIACALVVLVVWLSTIAFSRTVIRALLIFGIALNLGLCAWRLNWDQRIAGALSEYASVSGYIPDNVSLITLADADVPLSCRSLRPHALPCRFRPDWHFVDELLGDRPLAHLDNYQLRPQTGYFPLALRPPWTAYVKLIEALQRWPPAGPARAAVLSDVSQVLASLPPDVVVIWDDRLAAGGPPLFTPDSLTPILSGYDHIYTSSPLGAASVYLRRRGSRSR